MKSTFALIILLSFLTVAAQAQTNTFPSTGAAGIGTTNPDPSSLLEVVSTSKGILIPRMTKTQRDAIPTPSTGLLIYQTNTTPGFYYYSGTAWTAISTKGANTSLSNLAATTAVNVNLLPNVTNTLNLGSSTLRWKDVNLFNLKFSDGTTQTTAFTPYTNGTGISISGTSISLANSGVTAGTYGSSTLVPVITVDATGRITSASTSSVSAANTSLSNLISTSVNQSLIPSASNTLDLGSSSLGWKDVYATGSVYLDGSKFIDNRGTRNTFIGNNAGNPATPGSSNVAIGNAALKSYTRGFCVAVGDSALAHTVDNGFGLDNYNTAVGYASLTSNTSGTNNTASGYNALQANTTGHDNTASGSSALSSNSTGFENTASGVEALSSNTTGHDNTASGVFALELNSTGIENTASGSRALEFNTTGIENTASGSNALEFNSTGNYNTGCGFDALFFNTTGINNSGFGNHAGRGNTTGSFNTFVGDSANSSSGNLSNATAIGAYASVSSSNALVLGSISGVNGATSNVNVGIGTSSPAAKLHVVNGGTSGGTLNSNASVAIDKNGTSYLQLLTPDANENGIVFGTASSSSNGGIIFNNSLTSSGLQFRTGGNITRVRINSNGRVEIGNTTPSFRLQLNVDSAAKPSTSTWIVSSDARLKTNISDFTDGLDVLNKIHPVWFEYNGKAELPTGIKSVGIIAQEMQKIAPYMIGSYTYTDSLGKGTDYLDYNANALFYILVNSVKELSSQDSGLKTEDVRQGSKVDSLQFAVYNLSAGLLAEQKENTEMKNQIAQLQSEINNSTCPDFFVGKSVMTDGFAKLQTLNSKPETLLGQNIPNPFDNSTLIPFRIPKNCHDASIMITNTSSGEVISVIPISCNEDHVSIDAGTLASGTYSYTLYVDGKMVDTKQMELTK